MAATDVPGEQSAEATRRVLAAAADLDDPLERARALELAIERVPSMQSQIGRARAEALREAIEQRSASEVATDLGITRQRLNQILVDAAAVPRL